LDDTLFLDIGTGVEPEKGNVSDVHVVSESPGAVDGNVYEKAYEEEVSRIMEKKGKRATMYLTRRVEHNKALREHENIIGSLGPSVDTMKTGFSKLLNKARENVKTKEGASSEPENAG